MATDILFPFFEILVNRLFGNVGISLFALAAILAIILGLCRTSWTFILFWLMFYAGVMLTFYTGGIGITLLFILSGLFFVFQIVRLFFPDR